jgi:glucose-6-phosphate isomerase
VSDETGARQSREEEDANVICVGAQPADAETVAELTRVFVATPFSDDERHLRRIAKIADLESGLGHAADRAVRTRTAPAAEPARAATPSRAKAAAPAERAAAPASRAEPVARAAAAPARPVEAPPPPPPPVEAPAETVSAAVVEERPPATATAEPARTAADSRPTARPRAAPSLEDAVREAVAAVEAAVEPPAPARERVHALDDTQPLYRDPTTLAPTQAGIKQLEAMGFAERLWVKDATLWSTSADEQAAIRSRLGWLTSPTLMREYASDLKSFATEIRRLGFSNIVLLGMGGSSLAPEVISRTFGSKMGFPDLSVLDTTDPLAAKNTVARLPLSRTLFVVSSKSGSTVEVLALYKFFRGQVDASKPPKSGQHFIAITDPGSPLEKLAKEAGFRRTFLNHPSIGGRFSVLSFFGLVPAALIGVDIDRLLERAGEMVDACGDAVATAENPALVLAALIAGFTQKGRDKLTLVLSDRIRSFGLWLEQLIAESLGKDGKGVVPVDLEPLGRPDAYGKDRLFVSTILSGDPPDPALDALEAAGHPVYRITLNDPYDLGAEFFRWELATAAAGSLLGVNPFDEPNVAQAKEATQAVLAAYKKSKRLYDWPVDCEEDGIRLLTNQATKPASVTDGLGEFLGRAKPGDYVALLAYLTPDHETTDALQRLRLLIRDRLRVATTVGYGPRYLHSTGQLHKGGPPTILAIELTGDDKEDVAIPGESHSFAALKAAQALGDLETLRKANRHVIRLHLGGRAPTAIEKVAGMVSKALR